MVVAAAAAAVVTVVVVSSLASFEILVSSEAYRLENNIQNLVTIKYLYQLILHASLFSIHYIQHQKLCSYLVPVQRQGVAPSFEGPAF